MGIKRIWLSLVLFLITCFWTTTLHPQPVSTASGFLFGIQSVGINQSALVRIDPLTGTAVAITNLPVNTSQGVSTLDSGGHRYFFVGIDNALNRLLFVVNTQTGGVLSSSLVPLLISVQFEVSPLPVPT